ncbi:MAG: sulfurtransferase [Porticoccaceae bacterium]|nr:sulfurtransferase [Porticoccaceae bacterium]
MNFFIFVSEQWLLFSILIALIFLLIIYEKDKGGKQLGPHELVSLINSEEAVLIDLRPLDEFRSGHISGAINIPHSKLNSRHVELQQHVDKIVVLADKYGQHSGSSGKLLVDLGYNVRRLNGGMVEWRDQNMPVVKGA